jgi:hypothetical protein
LLTAEPLRAYGKKPDGALASVFAYVGADGAEKQLAELMRTARVIY